MENAGHLLMNSRCSGPSEGQLLQSQTVLIYLLARDVLHILRGCSHVG